MEPTTVTYDRDCNTCKHHDQGSSIDDVPARCWDCHGGSGSTRLRLWEAEEEPIAEADKPKITLKWTEGLAISKDAPPMIVQPPAPSKHPLSYAFDLALTQVTSGKGQERHGKGFASFWEQPWNSLADTHGFGFLTGQAAKKLQEAQGMDGKDSWEREMLGVLTYTAMAILHRAHSID